ncbi:hypothetical protein COJ46_09915 [Bacillus sp. AFS077874]|uniref:hypothetical protein n=1 Tax=unclassified Bacillus (in: firmicutes) TaxID=185979 RepID=UPI000BED260D|nr:MULTISPECIES: hypothetical protein [unclassified Bacillus (in: firmicutes)]PEC51058.1 hypothetical protein CON00_03215 [Bacillus sp. AFS096315]PFM81225.1 hypothetical protein COJ46_09915 [Bacillus sp. AFS077874]
MILTVLVLILLLILGNVLFKILPWKYITALFGIIVLLLIGFFIVERTSILVKNTLLESTSLKSERLNEIKIDKQVTPELLVDLKSKYGRTVKHTDIVVILSVENDRNYQFKKLYIGTKNNKINSIFSEDPKLKTNKGIGIGDDMSTIISKYGNNYIHSLEEIGETITYLDKERNVKLTFIMYKEKVFQMILNKY